LFKKNYDGSKEVCQTKMQAKMEKTADKLKEEPCECSSEMNTKPSVIKRIKTISQCYRFL